MKIDGPRTMGTLGAAPLPPLAEATREFKVNLQFAGQKLEMGGVLLEGVPLAVELREVGMRMQALGGGMGPRAPKVTALSPAALVESARALGVQAADLLHGVRHALPYVEAEVLCADMGIDMLKKGLEEAERAIKGFSQKVREGMDVRGKPLSVDEGARKIGRLPPSPFGRASRSEDAMEPEALRAGGRGGR